MRVAALLGIGGSAQSDAAVLRIAAQLGEVAALAVSGEPAPVALARARAAGTTQLARVWDAALESALGSAAIPAPASASGGSDADGPDESILATVLAAAARLLDAQIFVVGESPLGYVGPALAEQLNLPHLSAVLDAVRDAEDPAPDTAPTLIVHRRCLRGVQILRGPACGVLCVQPSDAPIAPAALSPDEVERWDLEQLGLGASDLPRPLLRAVSPERATRFAPRVFASAEALLERLRQDGLGEV